MSDIKPGDEVRLLQQKRRVRRWPIPDDGWIGKVVRTGKRYATAEFAITWTPEGGIEQTDTVEHSFDMESGMIRGDLDGYYVRTPEQLDRDRRRKEAVYMLDLVGLEFKLGHANLLTLEQLEALAEVVKRWEA